MMQWLRRKLGTENYDAVIAKKIGDKDNYDAVITKKIGDKDNYDAV